MTSTTSNRLFKRLFSSFSLVPTSSERLDNFEFHRTSRTSWRPSSEPEAAANWISKVLSESFGLPADQSNNLAHLQHLGDLS